MARKKRRPDYERIRETRLAAAARRPAVVDEPVRISVPVSVPSSTGSSRRGSSEDSQISGALAQLRFSTGEVGLNIRRLDRARARQADDARRLRSLGVSWKRIALITGTSPQAVMKLVKRP